MRTLLVANLMCAVLSSGCDSKPTVTAARPAEPAELELAGPPLFEDITAASGIKHTYHNGEDPTDKPKHLSILESLGGGAGLIDFDGDGRLDVFLPGGGDFAGPDRKEIVGRPCRLYRNLGGLKFEDATAAAGLDKLAGGKPWFYTHGVAVADYDRDGWPDLLATGWRAVALLRNVPVDPADPKKGRKFADVTAAAGLDKGITWTTSAAFADLDQDGYPDLYICQYVDWSWANNPPCTYDGKTPDVCAPKSFSGLPHKLFRNDGKGGFVDVSQEAGLLPGGPNTSKGLGVIVVDVDFDGRPDVYVANDTVDNFLYLNQSTGAGKLKFTELGMVSGTARDDRGTPNGSMGLDAGDPDRIGKPALWVTNYENELHALYRNDSAPGKPNFQFRTTASGIAAIGQRYVGWGTAFLDVDLDGWEDLFVANGHAIRYPTGKESSRKQRPVLLMNQGGKFRPASRRIGDYSETPRLARGVAFGDLDNDGRTDMVIAHTNELVAVLRGIGGQGNHWLGVRLVGKDNACIVGARAELTSGDVRQTRFTKGGGSYASSGDRRLLFGLGEQTTGRLTVRWPDGTDQSFDNLAADRYYRLTQGSTQPQVETAPGR